MTHVATRKGRRTKILHLITTFGDIGGAEMALYNLVSRLDRARFEPVVMCLVDEGRGWWQCEELEAAGIQIYAVGMQPGRPTPASVWRLIKMARRVRPDLIQ